MKAVARKMRRSVAVTGTTNRARTVADAVVLHDPSDIVRIIILTCSVQYICKIHIDTFTYKFYL